MAEIVYLLGAGASANALPVVSAMEHRIKQQIDLINSNNYLFDNNDIAIARNDNLDKVITKLQKTTSAYHYELLGELKWLQDICRTHTSPDTYAKKLALKKGQEDKANLRRLKLVLTFFFNVEEKVLFGIDKFRREFRYDNFLASILNKDLKIPDSIKILSWNYDSQFEIAYSDFVNKNDMNELRQALNIHSTINDDNLAKVAIYQINGAALFQNGRYNRLQGAIGNRLADSSNRQEVLKEIIISYATSESPDVESSIRFAWENDERELNETFSKIGKIVSDAQVLVIIGYTFPFFNRDIDKKMFEVLKRVNKVYIQAPEDSTQGIAERVKELFKSVDERVIFDGETLPLSPDNFEHKIPRKIDIQLRHNLNQFFLPNEL